MLQKSETILIVANCFWYVYNFRLDLIKLLKSEGYKVIVIAPKDEYKNLVKEYVNEIKEWKLTRGSINPFLEKQEKIIEYIERIDKIRSLYCISFENRIIE